MLISTKIRLVIVAILTYILTSLALIWWSVLQERKRVTAYNNTLQPPVTSMQVSSNKLKNAARLDPAFVLETSPLLQESGLIANSVEIRSKQTNRSLTIDWGMSFADLENIAPPEYSHGCPAESTSVGLHFNNSRHETHFRNRLTMWSLLPRWDNSNAQQYLLVCHYFPTCCISRCNPAQLIMDPFLVDQDEKNTQNAVELVRLGANIFLFRLPNTQSFLAESADSSAWSWKSIHYATEFVIATSAFLESNNYFPRIKFNKNSTLHASSMVHATASNFFEHIMPVTYAIDPNPPIWKITEANPPVWRVTADYSSNHPRVFAKFTKGQFVFADVITETSKQLLVHRGWFFQNYLVTQSVAGFYNHVVGSVLFEDPGGLMVSYVSTAVAAESSLTAHSEQFQMIIDRAFVSSPNFSYIDSENVYAIQRNPITNDYLKNNNDSHVTEAFKLYGATGFSNSNTMQSEVLAYPYNASNKKFQFRMIMYRPFKTASARIQHGTIKVGTSYPFFDDTHKVLRWSLGTVWKGLISDESTHTNNFCVFIQG